MIDGGVSDAVDPELAFCRAVGEKGKIFAFEPARWMAGKAAEKLSAYPNIRIYEEGLSDRDGWDVIIDNSYGSYLPQTRPDNENSSPEKAHPCKMTKIDTFVRNNDLKKVDCIKLDVEGSEMMALKGARETIMRFKPKLIICLYHKPADIFEIPLYINSLCGEYRMRLAHTQCSFLDTVLHAYVPDK